MDGLFHPGFKKDDVLVVESIFERKDGASFFPLALSSSLVSSRLQGPPLRISWK